MTGRMRRIICEFKYNVEKAVCTAENRKESRNTTSNTFHSIEVKQNPYGLKNWRRRPEPTLASHLSPSYNIPYL